MSGLQSQPVVYHGPMAGENPDFTQFVELMNCRMVMHDPCDGHTMAHLTGMCDVSAIPLCGKHRRALALGARPFSVSVAGRRDWELIQIKWVRSQWLTAS